MTSGPALTLRTIFSTWWPVAASWILMGIEMPLIAAVLGRLPDSEVQLAAYGGLVFPISLLIESPVIMLLAASTRLCDSRANYLFLRRFSRVLGYGLTAVHGLIAFTPLFDLIVVPLISPPAEVIESSRLGFQLMLPFTAAVAERRFHQGLLIRFGRQRQVGVGTIVRLIATVIPLAIALHIESDDGAAFAAIAVSIGVMSEAVFARVGAWFVERGPLRLATSDRRLDLRSTIHFYTPLALTSVISLASYSIASAGMNQMPFALASLALWPAVSGLNFFTRSSGVAFNEVAVRHAGDPGGRAALMKFALVVGTLFSLLVALIAFTPLGHAWYVTLEGSDPASMRLATLATITMIPMPILSFLASHWQGLLVDAHRTRPISEGVAIGLGGIITTLVVFINLPMLGGIVAATLAMTIGAAVQAAWLWWSWRRISRSLDQPVS